MPVYIDALHHARLKYDENFLLVEDGDPSHGMKRPGLARQQKDANWVLNLVHPPNSPDLNPSEAAWNMLKQRVRQIPGITRMNVEELKAVVQKGVEGY